MLVVVVDVLFCDFVSGLLLALVAVARFFVGLGIGFTLSSGNNLIPKQLMAKQLMANQLMANQVMANQLMASQLMANQLMARLDY